MISKWSRMQLTDEYKILTNIQFINSKQDLDMILEWMNINRLEINWTKTNAFIFTDKLKSENIYLIFICEY
jgi:hypothetical protein